MKRLVPYLVRWQHPTPHLSSIRQSYRSLIPGTVSGRTMYHPRSPNICLGITIDVIEMKKVVLSKSPVEMTTDSLARARLWKPNATRCLWI